MRILPLALLPVIAACAERALPLPDGIHDGGAEDQAVGAVDGAVPADLAFDPLRCAFGGDFPAAAPWPMTGRCPDHAGRGAAAGPRAPRLRWSFDTGRSLDSSPVVGAGEVVYIGGRDGRLHALEGATGAPRWTKQLEAPVGVPALAVGGELLVGGYTVAGNTWFHALDAGHGTPRWTYPVFEAFGPTLDGSGRVYFAEAGRVLALRVTNGDEQGQHVVRGSLGLDPLLVGGVSLVTATTRGVETVSLRGGGGGATWSASTEPYSIGPSLAAAPDGTVWAATTEGWIFAFDGPTGAVRVRHDAGAPIAGTPAIGADGTAWFGAGSRLLALRPGDAVPRRELAAPAAVLAVILDGDGGVYAGCADGSLHAVDTATGAVRWSFTVGGALRVRPAMGSDGTLYVPSDDGRLYAIGP